jgi:hypothetical protein
MTAAVRVHQFCYPSALMTEFKNVSVGNPRGEFTFGKSGLWGEFNARGRIVVGVKRVSFVREDDLVGS